MAIEVNWGKPQDPSLEGQVFVCNLCGTYSDPPNFDTHLMHHRHLEELNAIVAAQLKAVEELRAAIGMMRTRMEAMGIELNALRRRLNSVSSAEIDAQAKLLGQVTPPPKFLPGSLQNSVQHGRVGGTDGQYSRIDDTAERIRIHDDLHRDNG